MNTQKKSKKEIIISLTCPEHGNFIQTSNVNLNYGCPICIGSYDIKKVIIIQSLFRRYLCLSNLKKDNDSFTYNKVLNLLQSYILYNNSISTINKSLKGKKIRNCNFPSEISENIVKFVLYKKYSIMGNWNTKVGDLTLLNKRIEVKAFSSTGPSSFGPNEEWDIICFLDATNYKNDNYKLYLVYLSNSSVIWKNIKINGHQLTDIDYNSIPELPTEIVLQTKTNKELQKLIKDRYLTHLKTKNKQLLINHLLQNEICTKYKNETYEQICLNKKRPRISFSDIKKQLDTKHIKLIWEGSFIKLFH